MKHNHLDYVKCLKTNYEYTWANKFIVSIIYIYYAKKWEQLALIWQLSIQTGIHITINYNVINFQHHEHIRKPTSTP